MTNISQLLTSDTFNDFRLSALLIKAFVMFQRTIVCSKTKQDKCQWGRGYKKVEIELLNLGAISNL